MAGCVRRLHALLTSSLSVIARAITCSSSAHVHTVPYTLILRVRGCLGPSLHEVRSCTTLRPSRPRIHRPSPFLAGATYSRTHVPRTGAAYSARQSSFACGQGANRRPRRRGDRFWGWCGPLSSWYGSTARAGVQEWEA